MQGLFIYFAIGVRVVYFRGWEGLKALIYKGLKIEREFLEKVGHTIFTH